MMLNINLNTKYLCSFGPISTTIPGCCSEKIFKVGNHYRELHEVLPFFHYNNVITPPGQPVALQQGICAYTSVQWLWYKLLINISVRFEFLYKRKPCQLS